VKRAPTTGFVSDGADAQSGNFRGGRFKGIGYAIKIIEFTLSNLVICTEDLSQALQDQYAIFVSELARGFSQRAVKGSALKHF